MPELFPLPYQLAWPIALALAWVAGEFGHRWTDLPRISIYGLAGFLFGNVSSGFLPQSEADTFMLLANVAFGLMLFELGYRINLHWLRTNPWIAVAGVVEAVGTFVAVHAVAIWFNTPQLTALLLASLVMATSPAGILRVFNEQCSAGQVTERALHLSALNCVLAVFTFKVIIGISVFQNSGSLPHAAWSSLAVLTASAMLGAGMGMLVPALLRQLGNLARDATLAFAIAVILLVAITHAFKFSPVLATLTFGLVARHRRITLSHTQRNFGVMGDLLTVLLFFFVASTLKWEQVVSGITLALAIIGVRFAVKIFSIGIFSRVSGISWRKGLLTGLSMMPISVFAILLLEQARRLDMDLIDSLSPLAGVALLLGVMGPVITQCAVKLANEIPDSEES